MDPALIDFDEGLRARLGANLKAHDRRRLPLDGRRHAAVALVIVDSDAERDDTEPVPEGAIDMSEVPGGAIGEGGRRLDGRMIGVAGGASFLICRRPLGMRRHAGQWALPGGRLDPGETPLDGALRELDEELALRLDARPRDRVAGRLRDALGVRGLPVVLWCAGDPVIEPDPDEVFAAYRIGLHALRDSSPRLVEIPESDRPVLQVPLGGDLIHAPTGAILFQFREVALLGRPGQRVAHVEEPVFAWR